MFELVRKIIAKELGISESEITLDSTLTGDLGLESMDMYNLIDVLFDEGVEIEEGNIFETVEDLVNAAKEN